jgi:hypothetical protein
MHDDEHHGQETSSMPAFKYTPIARLHSETTAVTGRGNWLTFF